MQSTHKITYREAWTFLDQLQFFKIKLGLDSMNIFMESLDNPQRSFPCIHIGGTNGKGSVGATLLSILTAAGYKVGFYTSPHLSSVRERFRIGNDFISRDEFASQAQKISNILNGKQITYFEFTTALAMLWFASKDVDLVILEVGLGGRLDATNIVTPLVSVITNVSMDHEQYLGNTIEEVATEKAGIIKPGIPVVTGASGEKTLGVLSNKASSLNSKLHILGKDFSGEHIPGSKHQWTYRGIQSPPVHELPLNMRGDYQVANASIALATLEQIYPAFQVSPEQIRNGLEQVHWPGRLEEFWRDYSAKVLYKPLPDNFSGHHFLLDGAHNPAGAQALKKSLKHDFEYDRLILVWASMADKDITSSLMEIAPLAECIIFTQPDEERSAKPEQLQHLLPQHLQQKSVCIKSVKLALDKAMSEYTDGSMICVAGSLYLVGGARQILCGDLVDDE